MVDHDKFRAFAQSFVGGSEAERGAGFLGRQNGKMIWHHEGKTGEILAKDHTLHTNIAGR